MANNKLAPGCWAAHVLADMEIKGEAMSIEFLWNILDSLPTYPEAWTKAEASDFVNAYIGR